MKKSFDECYISDAYDEYLSNILENCKKYDYDSVFRKVIWMDIFFIPKYEKNILNCKIYHVAEHDRKYIKKFNPFTLISKGNQALEAVEYCIEKRTP